MHDAVGHSEICRDLAIHEGVSAKYRDLCQGGVIVIKDAPRAAIAFDPVADGRAAFAVDDGSPFGGSPGERQSRSHHVQPVCVSACTSRGWAHLDHLLSRLVECRHLPRYSGKLSLARL